MSVGVSGTGVAVQTAGNVGLDHLFVGSPYGWGTYVLSGGNIHAQWDVRVEGGLTQTGGSINSDDQGDGNYGVAIGRLAYGAYVQTGGLCEAFNYGFFVGVPPDVSAPPWEVYSVLTPGAAGLPRAAASTAA
jgi:hypothetical protein